MILVKTPTSSLTVGELLVNRIWYRTKAKIVWSLGFGAVAETSTARPSPISRLPQELVGMVISCFVYDKRSLLACSMTCYSWYMIAVSYLHYSLTTDDELPCRGITTRYFWPRPLKKSYEFGLLSLVKRFRIRLDSYSLLDACFTSDRFGRRTLRYISALTNLQELGIDYLQIPSFMPNIQRYFGHFSPTLRFLALRNPRGSCRQILYLIGLFPNLQDLKICYESPGDEWESAGDPTLVPLSIPPLRGWLTLTCLAMENLVKDMMFFFGGLRFRHIDLFKVKCTRLVLDACAGTLETLRLYPTDPYENNGDLLHHFNLSRNKHLRTLETTAEAIESVGNAASDFFKTILPSAVPSAPLDVVIIYRDFELGGSTFCLWCAPGTICFRHQPWELREKNARFHQWLLGVFREMHDVWDFRLVLCADVSDCMVEHGKGELERIAKAGQLPRQPLVIAERRTVHTRYNDYNVGGTRGGYVFASAL